MRVLVVDITGLYNDEGLKGHLLTVAKNYKKILSPFFDVKIAGGNIYKKYISDEDLLLLPYDCNMQNKKNGLLLRFKRKICEIINVKAALKSDADAIIFQSYSRLFPYLFGIILFKKRFKKVYIIQYVNFKGNVLEKILLSLSRKRINGIICGMDTVGISLRLPYLNIPDYIYTPTDYNKEISNVEIKYDFIMVGIMGADKNIEHIIEYFSKTSYRVLIAGRFIDEERSKHLSSLVSENIIIRDEYLSLEEYERLINQAKYILLPYLKGYDTHSSGVVLDAIFRKKPVIVSDVKAFKFVRDYKLGFIYKNTISEFFEQNKNYNEYISNIEKYLSSYEVIINRLVEFITK